MLTQEELAQSPLFENIRYDEYRRMLSCFHAVQKTFRPDELIYDLGATGGDAVVGVRLGELREDVADALRRPLALGRLRDYPAHLRCVEPVVGLPVLGIVIRVKYVDAPEYQRDEQRRGHKYTS